MYIHIHNQLELGPLSVCFIFFVAYGPFFSSVPGGVAHQQRSTQVVVSENHGQGRGFNITMPIGSMYAIYGNIYHQYTPNVRIYTIHGSYGMSQNPGNVPFLHENFRWCSWIFIPIHGSIDNHVIRWSPRWTNSRPVDKDTNQWEDWLAKMTYMEVDHYRPVHIDNQRNTGKIRLLR